MGLISTLRTVIITLILAYSSIPLLLYIHPGILKGFIYMTFARSPFDGYSNLTHFGIESRGRNFYLESLNDQKIGVWHILPVDLNESAWFQSDQHLITLLANEKISSTPRPVVIYCHGNGGTRRASHRVEIINLFSQQGYHAVAFDYRGYADSEGEASEENMINDAISVYNYVRERVGSNTPVFIWGHSLGTAITGATTSRLCKANRCPSGFVLESGFNNLNDIISSHPFGAPFRWLPFFHRLFINPMREFGVVMNTDERLTEITVPLLILHAHDDKVVPFDLAVKLHKSAVNTGLDTTFVDYDYTFGYGHKYVCRAPDLPDVMYEFVNKCKSLMR